MKKSLISVVLCATLSQAGVFSIDVNNTDTAQSFSQSFTSVTDTFDSIDTNAIKSRIGYQDTDGVSALVDFRGLPMKLAYAANQSDLTLTIDSVGVTKVFTGTNRDQSVELMKDWFKTDGGALIEKIMKKLVEVSSSDPIAGNPNSIMSRNVSSDFSTGFMDVATKQQGTSTTSSSNSISIAPTYSSLDVAGVNSQSYSLPLGYSFNFDSDVNEKISISLPINYTDVEGSKSGSLGLGLAYSKPVTSSWTLTPAVGYGATGSVDLGSLAQVASASLTSSYQWDLSNDYTLSMGNMVGYYATVKFYSGDYAYDPGIKNVVYRNALMLNIPTNCI